MAAKTPRQRSLFGGFQPPPRDPRGRKRIVWNSQVAETVALMAAGRATQEAIAAAVEVSVKTLARIYADELARGAELIRQAIFRSQVGKAVEGNTPAARFVMAELRREEVEEIAYRGRRAPAPASQPKLGKKEERQAAAEQIGGMYAPGAPPAKLAH